MDIFLLLSLQCICMVKVKHVCECWDNESHMGCDLNTRKEHQWAIQYLIAPTPFHTPMQISLVLKVNDILCFRLSESSKFFLLNPI